jgi:hypothetical protein
LGRWGGANGKRDGVDRRQVRAGRAALEEMRMHRHRLVNLFLHSQERDYNVSSAIRSLDDDLSAIEAGIERL